MFGRIEGGVLVRFTEEFVELFWGDGRKRAASRQVKTAPRSDCHPTAPSPEAVSLTCPVCLWPAARLLALYAHLVLCVYFVALSLCTLGNEWSRGLAAWFFVCIQTNGTPEPNLLPCAKAPLKGYSVQISAAPLDITTLGLAVAPGHAAMGGCQRAWLMNHATLGANQAWS